MYNQQRLDEGWLKNTQVLQKQYIYRVETLLTKIDSSGGELFMLWTHH